MCIGITCIYAKVSLRLKGKCSKREKEREGERERESCGEIEGEIDKKR